MRQTRHSPGRSAHAASTPRAAWRARLTGRSARDQHDLLVDAIVAEIAAVTGQPAGGRAGLDRRAPWRSWGIYRDRAERLRGDLGERIGIRLPATLLFDEPSPDALAEYLRHALLGAGEPGGASARDAARHAGRLEPGGVDDPVVVVGMGCRLAGGVDSPEALWEVVRAGRDVTGGLPVDRGWDLAGLFHPDPDHAGTAYTRRGGFVVGVDRFDASFFGMGPREAAALDPQQRLMLEVSWEAVERAGIDPHALRGSPTGVFTGVSLQDYGPAWHTAQGEARGQLLTGTAAGVIAGRVAYHLGLEGPALCVDTQCSASLVAIHLAAQALRAGECDLALAGGVTVMSTPGILVEFSRKKGLAPDGRCKAFSADADGTGWADGAGVLLLERLSDARRHHHPIHAILRGSAINNDGASNGLTAPNGRAQTRLLRQALTNAALHPTDIDAIEAHGTGTALGDPIEAQALHAAYAPDRTRPLWLGSLKSNIGHAQAAAGVSGVIKMIQALQHETLPKTLHAERPSPHIDWSSGAVALLTDAVPWPREPDRPRRAGISAFGISGTNAHVIIEEAPPAGASAAELPTPALRPGSPVPYPLSARTPQALRAAAERLAAHLCAHPRSDPMDVAHTLAGRSRFEHRAVVLASPASAVDQLRALAADRAAPGVVRGGGAALAGRRLAMLFTGQGSQRAGMGRALHAAHPTFADALDDICARFDPHLDRPLRDVMFAAPDTPDAALLDRTEYTQPALFAYGTALYRLVTSWGITPAALAGHSIGELTAAHVAGVWSLEDAVTVVAARGRLAQACRAGGAMIAIRASADDVTASLVGQDGRVEIAAVNGPAAVVIAGDADAAERIAAGWASRGHATRRLTVSHAFHSPHMDGMLARFRQVVGGVDYRRPAVPVVSTLTGATDEAELCSPDHWVRQARGPVRFLDAVHHLAAAERADTFVELGPDAVLTALLADCLPAVSAQPPSARPHAPETVAVATARAHRPEPDVLLATLATLDVHGVDVDWRAVLGPAGRLVDLPTYPFQRRRHWLSPPSPTPAPGPEPATESGTAAAAAGPEPTSGAGGWWYRPVWRRLDAADVTAAVAAQAGPTPPLGGHWAVLVPPAGVGGALVERVSWLVERLGGVPVPVMLASADRRAIAERLTTEGFTAAGPPVGGLVSLLALDTSPCADHPGLGTGLALTVALAQALADLRVEAPLWAITTGAVPTGPADPVTCPEQAMIWGLGRTLALEAPRTWGGLIDVPLDRAGGLADELRAPDDQSLLWLGVALTAPGGEDQFAVRPDGLWVARLRAEDGPGGAPAGRRWSPAGTVLITGGTGALGGQIARELARGGTDRLVLVGRRGPDTAGARELVGELAALGARATVAACDVGDADQFTALLDQLAAGGEPVTAVVHAAGVAGPSAPLERLDLAAFADVLAAKATGAAVLGRLLADPHTALREVVLVSSIAAVWGSGGQAAYSAANAYLDALAATRTVTGRRLTAVAFGPWADAGIGAEPALRDFLTRRGLRPLDPPSAAGALTHAVAARHPASVVVDVDWARFLPAITAARPSRYFEELALPPTPRSDPSGVGGATAAPPTLPAPRSGAEYADLVRAQAAAVLGHDTPADVDPRRRFLELGFDSLASVELRRRLAAATGLPLGTQAVFEHPTVADLAAHLRSIAADRGDQPDATPSPRPTTSTGAVGDAGGDDGVELAGGVRWLYRQACAQGRFAAGVGVLRAAARLRPVFRTAGEFGTPPRLVRLATGPAPFVLVCLPSLVAPSGPHNFARLALHLHGRRDVHALAHPGFGDGELLPASADLVIGMHADAVARAFPGRPAVLAGYSSGGWLAHATAAALEERGVRPAAVALLDTWLPTDQIPEEDIHEELRGIAVNDQAFALMTEAQVTAQGAYLDLFEHWRPRQVEAPVMLVRAARRMPRRVVAEDVTGPDQAWTTDWEMGHDSFDVAGDHQSMMHEHAETTARDVDRWLRGLEARDGHPARDHDRDGGAGRPAAGVGRLPARPSV